MNSIRTFSVLFVIVGYLANVEDARMKKLLVVFRHGDRAPGHFSTYPTDPNRNYIWEDGLGNLTTIGKAQGLELGSYLRQRYEHYLTFNPNEVLARSSSVLRSIYTTACVLVGIYNPNNTVDCYNSTDYTPAPIYTVTPLNNDHMLYYPVTCPRLVMEARKILRGPEYGAKFAELQPILEQLKQLTGLENNVTEKDAAYLYDLFNAQALHNLTLPEWAKTLKVEVEQFYKLRIEALSAMVEVAKIGTGHLLNDILIRTKEDVPNMKLYLYGTHDALVMAIMKLMHVYNGVLVPYAAAVIIEVHNRGTGWKNRDYIEIYYRNSSVIPPYKMSIEGCSDPCTVERFCRLTGVYAIEDPKKACELSYQ